MHGMSTGNGVVVLFDDARGQRRRDTVVRELSCAAPEDIPVEGTVVHEVEVGARRRLRGAQRAKSRTGLGIHCRIQFRKDSGVRESG